MNRTEEDDILSRNNLLALKKRRDREEANRPEEKSSENFKWDREKGKREGSRRKTRCRRSNDRPTIIDFHQKQLWTALMTLHVWLQNRLCILLQRLTKQLAILVQRAFNATNVRLMTSTAEPNIH